jgi:hypothetical protein
LQTLPVLPGKPIEIIIESRVNARLFHVRFVKPSEISVFGKKNNQYKSAGDLI